MLRAGKFPVLYEGQRTIDLDSVAVQINAGYEIKLSAHLSAQREEHVKAALAERVNAHETGEESDRAYNQACEDVAAAIRALGEGR